MSEAVLLIDGIPDSMGGRASVTSEAFGVFDEVDVFTLGEGVQEAKVGIPIVAPGQFVYLAPFRR